MKPSDNGGDQNVMESSYQEHEIAMKGHLNTTTFERVDDNADKTFSEN